jgi:hemerythrin
VRAFIEWRDEWLLGISQVNGEHQELTRLFNRAAERFSCAPEGPSAGKASERSREIIGLLQEFGEHVRIHFENEEDVMHDAGYPDFESHRVEHLTLLAEYAELLRELDKKGVECLDAETLDSLKTWLIYHVANEDIRFGEFYRNRARGGANPPE